MSKRLLFWLVVLAAAACGPALTPLPYTEAFSDPVSGWKTASDEAIRSACRIARCISISTSSTPSRGRRPTVFIIEHIMRAIMALSDWIVVIHFGRKIAEGTPAEISRNPGVISAYLGEEGGQGR